MKEYGDECTTDAYSSRGDAHADTSPMRHSAASASDDLVNAHAEDRRLTIAGEKDEGKLLFKLPQFGRTSTDVRLSALEVGHEAPYDMESKFPGLRAAIKEKFGNYLRAWIVGFKQPLTGSMKFRQFVDTIQHWTEHDKHFREAIDYAAVFDAWNRDRHQNISLRELDPVSALNFEALKDFVLQKFASVVAFFKALGTHGSNGTLTKIEFINGLTQLGFTGNSDSLFSGLDAKQQGCVTVNEFLWVEEELNRKTEALARIAGQETNEQRLFKLKALRNRQRKAERRLSRLQFLSHCKQKVGSILRAWRVIDRNEDMSISHKEFMHFCVDTGFPGNRRLAWAELDKDDSGFATLEEFDMMSAMMLAQFRDFILTEFTTFEELFQPGMLEKKTTLDVFLAKIHEWGFQFRPPFLPEDESKLFRALDFSGCGTLRREDIMFFRKWIPPPWLTCSTDYDACEKFIEHLTKFYGTTLRAWKAMDQDGSNRLTWQEFFRVALHCKFSDMRSLPLIWRALDEDLKGYISLKDLDHAGSDILESFVRWARAHFGSVVTAFQVLDHDQNGELSYYEFRSAVRLYRYKGNTKELFTLLDVKNKRLLGAPAVAFLDHWDLDDDEEHNKIMMSKKQRKKLRMLYKVTGHEQQEQGKAVCPKHWCTRSSGELEYVRNMGEKPSLPAIQSVPSAPPLDIAVKKRKPHDLKKMSRNTLLAYAQDSRPRKTRKTASPYVQTQTLDI